MNRINYDFTEFEKIMSSIKQNPNNTNMNRLKGELNRFFKDSHCELVYYSKNTDKPFFGMCVIPQLPSDIIQSLLSSSNHVNYRIRGYVIDIDSKLFEIGLTNRELVAVLLHEVGHMVNSNEPLNKVQDITNKCLVENHNNINIIGLHRNVPLFTFAIKDSVYMVTSLFKKKDDEILADEFVVYCGYGEDLQSAFNRIVKKCTMLNNNIDNKFLVLQWTLKIYKELKLRRINVIKTLTKAVDLTGSELQKREMKNVLTSVNRVVSESVLNESIRIFKKGNSVYSRMKYNGMKILENELFEISLKVKNVDEHDDALAIMRQLNSNISVIEDFITTEHLTEKDMDKWCDILSRYKQAREELSKKTTYDEKYYGLFVKMPNVRSRYEI